MHNVTGEDPISNTHIMLSNIFNVQITSNKIIGFKFWSLHIYIHKDGLTNNNKQQSSVYIFLIYSLK
jgi:hypothetical protein